MPQADVQPLREILHAACKRYLTVCCISDYSTGGFPNYSWVMGVGFPTLITAAVCSGMSG